jgi:cysteine dioxygenase
MMESDQYTDEKRVPVIESLQQLTEHLGQVFNSDKVNVDYVKAVLAAYKSNPKDWKTYAKFDKHRYTRNLVDTGNGKYNLIALCWGEGQGSGIHDHSDAHCFVKVLDGQLKETMFAWPAADDKGETTKIDYGDGSGLTEIGVNFYEKNGVTYINDSMGLHRVENPSHSEPAVSLHLYSPPFEYCQAFDQRTGVAHKVKMTFWSKYGQRTPFCETIDQSSSPVAEKPYESTAVVTAVKE